MASTYVNDLRLNEMATGDGSGTWGTTTNLNLELIAEKFGTGSEALSDASTATITMADGASDAFRSLALTLTGSLSQACTVTLAPNTLSNVWMIKNSAGDAVTLTQGTGANVVIPNGFTKVVYSDGAGAGAAVTDTFDDLSIGPNLIIGNGAAEDTKILFDGNAQDFYIGLDDSADDLVIGKGSALGTTQAMAIDENMDVAFGPTTNVTITNDGNEDTLTLVSTDADASAGPNLRMYRNSSSPADADVLGVLDYEGRNDNSQDVVYASITAQANDVSDGTEDGSYYVSTMVGGTLRNRMNVLHTETVFNQEAIALDFRIESDNNSHVFFVDGTNDHVNIGAVTDRGGLLNIETSDNSVNLALVSTDADANIGPVLELWRNSASPADGDELGRMYFYGENDNDEKIEMVLMRAAVNDVTDGSEDSQFQIFSYVAGAQKDRLLINPTQTTFNDNGADLDFRVESAGNSKAISILGDKYGLGVGRDPETAYNGYTSIELGQQGAILSNDAGDDFWFATNNYLNGSGNSTKKETGVAGLFQIDGDIARFYTAATGSADTTNTWVSRVRFDSDGIKFGADTSVSNALNDYEEGSFTMGVSGATFADGNYNQTAYYTKIGQNVFFYYYTSNYNCSSASGAAKLTGLPFTAKGAGYSLFQYLHGTGVDGNSTGGYINVSATDMSFVDANSTALSSFIDGSAKYIMVQGVLCTDG